MAEAAVTEAVLAATLFHRFKGDQRMSDATVTDDPILDIDAAWAELRRQGLNWTRRQVQRQATEFRNRPGGLPFKKLPNGHLAIRRSALLQAIAL